MSSKSAEELTGEVKKHTRGVLLSKIGGVALVQFERDYRELLGKRFPYRELGFSDTRSCLESMSDTVRFEYSEAVGKWILFGIADSHSFMSSSAIKAQFTPDKLIIKRKRIRNKKFSPKKSSDSDETTQRHAAHQSKRFPGREDKSGTANDQRRSANSPENDKLELQPNMKGLYGICVPRLPPDREAEVLQLFSEVASSEESSRGGSHFFLRYKNRDEAEDVISRFNEYRLDELRLSVQPAREKKGRRDNIPTQSARPKGSATRELDVENNQETSQLHGEASRCDNRDKSNGNGVETSYRKQPRTGKPNGKAQRLERSPNKNKDSRQSSPRDRGERDSKRQAQSDVITSRLPWQQTLQPNGDVLGSPDDLIEEDTHENMQQLDVFAASQPVEPVVPSTQTDSVRMISNRTIPKPSLPSILDLADRLKGTAM